MFFCFSTFLKEWTKADDKNLKSLLMIYRDNWNKISASVPHPEEEIEQRWAYINSKDYEEPEYVFKDVCVFFLFVKSVYFLIIFPRKVRDQKSTFDSISFVFNTKKIF